MIYKALKACALIFLLANTQSFAQSENENQPKTEIGSTVLSQEGSSTHNYENGVYSYEKVIDVPGMDKATLYDRAKQWMVANLKTSKEAIFFDDNDKSSITVTTGLRLKDNYGITSQSVDFKLAINFKDGKMRIQATDFVYHGLYPGSLWQKSFHDLRPLNNKVRRTIYEEFDDQFVAMRKGLTKAVKNTSSDNW